MRFRRFASLGWAPLALGLLQACRGVETPGCLGGDERCTPPVACGRLQWDACTGGSARVFRVDNPSQRPRGLRAEAALGDLVLENDQVVAVIDAIDHPHHLALSGGTLVDLATRDGADHLNQVAQVTGILPRDSARYTTLQSGQDSNGAFVIARGVIDGDPAIRITTRYDLRPCEPGVRVRTEVYNGGRNPWTWFVGDVYWWGDRSITPFVPLRGQGFRQPRLDLLAIDGPWREFPWVAAQSHLDPDASYTTVPCERPFLSGVNNAVISAAGLPRTLVRPGDGLVFERLILVSRGSGLAGAQSLALKAREKLFNEARATIRGRVVDAMGRPLGGDERLVSLLFYEAAEGAEPDDDTKILPWVETVPAADGTFSVDVPAGRSLRYRVTQLGRPIGAGVSTAGNTLLGDIVVRPPPRVRVRVTSATNNSNLPAEIIVVPTGMSRREDVAGSQYGYFSGCAPWLGPAHGASPACNRVLAFDGTAEFSAPAGMFWVYAHAGPERTLAREMVVLREGDGVREVNLTLRDVPGLYPSGALTGDFHVHGGRSFDIGFPDRERVMSFVTSGVQVIAATDHDVITDYSETVRALGVGDRVRIMSGAETTPEIPYLYFPGRTGALRGPLVIGHFMFWPLQYDPSMPGNGLPWDELVEPGALFDRMRPRMTDTGVIQLNHPMADSILLRDLGYPRALDLDLRRPLPESTDDGTNGGRLFRRPGTTAPMGMAQPHRNIDWNAQEAMQGTNLLSNVLHRQFWHFLLNQGHLRTGTANSDSHSLSEEQLGYPRNVVLSGQTLATFDPAVFNRAVREGNIVGTNGPYVDATIDGEDGMRRGPSLRAFRPASSATLRVVVRAPPWIPVEEVRVVVNGTVVRTITGSEIRRPADPFGTEGLERWSGTFPVAELLGGRDGWIVVEAGHPLPRTADSDNDGLVDFIDGDNDGVADDERVSDPPETDARFHAHTVSPGHWPIGFTNPWILDLAGDGWTPPGLPMGAR